MRKLIFLLCMIPLSAMAQETVPPECKILKDHKPSADVAYQSGVDVNGNPVVPADINAMPMGMDAQTIVIPLSIDMAQRLQASNIAGLDMTSTLGFIEVGPGGRVTYNGQDLTSQVYVLCDRATLNPVPSANGQTPSQPVEYAPVREKPKGAPYPKPVTPVLKTPEPKSAPKKEPAMGEEIKGGDYQEEGYE